MMKCNIVVIVFGVHSCYCIHFQTNTLGESLNPLIPPDMG